MDDIHDLLQDTDEQLGLVNRIYKESAEAGKQSRRLKPRIKNTLENQRSVLDYLAHEIHNRYGSPTGAKIYYPLAKTPQAFPRDIDQRMPGVRAEREDIANVIERYQPFNQEWIVWLAGLTNENKHRILSKHKPHETTRTEVHLPDGGSFSVQDIEFQDAAGNPITPSQAFGRPTSDPIPVLEWRFADPPLPATLVLSLIQTSLKTLVADVSQVADL